MGLCFFRAVVSMLQGRFMLAEPAIWGILSTVEMSLGFTSPSKCLWILFRCCFMDFLRSRSCYPPFLAVYGSQAIWQSGIPVLDQEPDFGLNFWAIGWELFKTVRNPLHKWPHLPLHVGNFHNFWTNVEKSFPEQTWFCHIWCWPFSG